MDEIVFPVRVMKVLGIQTLLVSNAAGAINTSFKKGELMMITDHINLQSNALIGKNLEELGPRFPDMSEPYDHKMIALAKDIAKEFDIKVALFSSVVPKYELLLKKFIYKYFHL